MNLQTVLQMFTKSKLYTDEDALLGEAKEM